MDKQKNLVLVIFLLYSQYKLYNYNVDFHILAPNSAAGPRGFAGLAIDAFPAEKSVDHSPTDQRGTHAGHLMRCRSRNSLGFDLISLAFFGPLFMAPGRFRPFPLPLLACPGRAKSRRGAGLVRSG